MPEKNVLGIITQAQKSIYHDAALRFFDEILYINPLKVSVMYARERSEPVIYYEGKYLNGLSMLYILSEPKNCRQSIIVLINALLSIGCPVSDDYSRYKADSVGKCFELSVIQKTKANTNSIVINSIDSFEQLVKRADVQELFPLVAKLIHGFKGLGVEKLNSIEEATTWVQKHFSRYIEPLILEEFMEFIQEWRVLIVDNNIVCSNVKILPENSFKGNFHQGAGKAKAMQTEALYHFIEQNLPEYCKHGIYGVDVALTSNSEFHLIEINRTPGLTKIQEITGVDFLDEANKILFRRARKFNKDFRIQKDE